MWHRESNTIVCLSAKGEDHLKEILQKAEGQGIATAHFKEPDRADAITAIVLAPGNRSKKLLQGLPLALKT